VNANFVCLKKAADEVIEVNREELQALLERKRETLGEEDYQKRQKLLRAFSRSSRQYCPIRTSYR